MLSEWGLDSGWGETEFEILIIINTTSELYFRIYF